MQLYRAQLRICHTPARRAVRTHQAHLAHRHTHRRYLQALSLIHISPIISPTFGRALLAVRLRTSGVPDSHGVTGGVYKARERIHRGMLIRDY